jgi:hypothetical protein
MIVSVKSRVSGAREEARPHRLKRAGMKSSIKKCAISREQFSTNAQPVTVTINGKELTAEVKEFSTGSFGWYLNAKTDVQVGDKKVPVQIGMNLTVVGSKDAD